MSEQNDFDQKRDGIIEHIKKVFPKKPRLMGKKATFEVTYSDYYPSKELREVFSGKLWEELIDYPGIAYYLSDIDYTGIIHDKAYLYYLPTFLVAMLKEPSLLPQNHFGSFRKINGLLSRFSLEQLDILIAYFQFQIDYIFSPDEWFLEPLEDMLLNLMLRRDELAKDE
jgi:hypothetical protein